MTDTSNTPDWMILAERIGPTEAEIAAATVLLETAKQSYDTQKASAQIQCRLDYTNRHSPIKRPCGEWFSIKDAVYIDVQYWVSAYGCTGGAYWKSDEGRIVCPLCGFLNRTYTRETISEYEYVKHFKERIVAYPNEHSFLSDSLRFENNRSYPYPDHVAKRLEAKRLEREAETAQARAESLRLKAASLLSESKA
jgi:hypothetical protein